MRKFVALGKRSLEVSTNARRAWNDFKVFRRSNATHVVWGRLSIEYKSDFDCEACKDAQDDCQECCPHEFDSSEGGTCLNCGRDDYYNFLSEDAGGDR